MAQILAGILLIFPAKATMGAVLYFPIIVNIFVITLSVEFGLRSAVAGLMLLANPESEHLAGNRLARVVYTCVC